jgi:NADH-quinone oxidoreductase subunit L
MLLPMMFLAVLSFGAGLVIQYGMDFGKFLGGSAALSPEGHSGPAWFVPAAASVAAIGGIALAILFYARKAFSASALARAFQPVYNTLVNGYWFDELFTYGAVLPAEAAARALSFFDSRILDRTGGNSFVNVWGLLADRAGSILRRLQTGLVQNYALFAVVGFGLMVVWRMGFLHR